MIEVIINCSNFNKKAKYIFETFFTYYHCPFRIKTIKDDSEIVSKSPFILYYGKIKKEILSKISKAEGLLIPFDEKTENFFAQGKKYDYRKAKVIDSIPYLFYSDKPSSGFEQIEKLPVLSEDPIASSFYFLSGYQEYLTGKVDEYGRFPFSESLQAQLDIIETPIVNRYFKRLAQNLPEELEVKRRPLIKNSDFVVALSHDVDFLNSSILNRGRYVIGRLTGEDVSIKEKMSILSHLLQPIDWQTKILMELEREYNCLSSFNFCCLRGRRGVSYSVHSKKVGNLIKEIGGTAFELGLHGSHGSITQGTLTGELKIFKKYARDVMGGRIHNLGFQVRYLFETLNDLPISYDSSMMFAERIGFRTGSAFPHLLYDFNNEHPFNTLQIPLNIMDTTLFARHYMNLDKDEAWERIEKLLTIIKNESAFLTIVFHPQYFFSKSCLHYTLYKKVLAYINKNNGMGTNLRNVYLWWKDKERHSINKQL